MPSSINSRRSESESWLQRVRNCSARRLAAVLSSADELACFVFIGLTVARALGGAPFQFLAFRTHKRINQLDRSRVLPHLARELTARFPLPY